MLDSFWTWAFYWKVLAKGANAHFGPNNSILFFHSTKLSLQQIQPLLKQLLFIFLIKPTLLPPYQNLLKLFYLVSFLMLLGFINTFIFFFIFIFFFLIIILFLVHKKNFSFFMYSTGVFVIKYFYFLPHLLDF